MSSNTAFSIGLLAGLGLALAAALLAEAKRPKPAPPPPLPPDVVYALDSAALRSYGEQVRQATGDSLRRLFSTQAAKARKRVPAFLVRDTVRDTVPEVCLPEVDVRTLLVADTACRVTVDSFARVDTLQKYHLRLQREKIEDQEDEIAAQAFQKKFIAGMLVLGATATLLLNFVK